MTTTTRSEHVEWAKARALAYVDSGDLYGALASMASDLNKHPETHSPVTDTLFGLIGARHAVEGNTADMRRFIEGFN